MDGEYEFNSKVIFIALIIIGLAVAIFFPYQSFEKPKIKNITVNITVTPTPEIQYIYITPTPDNGIYFVGEYNSGIRKLGRWFSWQRINATGYKDMSGHVKVYDYRILQKVHIFDNAENKYYEQTASNGAEYLFVFVKIYLDEFSGDDTRMWVPNENHYAVHIGENSYGPIPWTKEFRMREFEETVTENGDSMVWYYGIFSKYSRDESYRKTGGYFADPIYYIKAGESNAIDGYIVYEIPLGSNENEIRVAANMYAFGEPIWKLKS